MLTIDQLQKAKVKKKKKTRNSLARYNIIKFCMVMSRRMTFSMNVVVKYINLKIYFLFMLRRLSSIDVLKN